MEGIESTTPTEQPAAVYVSLATAASRTGMSRWTLYHWIGERKVTEERGLRRMGARRMIEWCIFKAAIDRGEFA